MHAEHAELIAALRQENERLTRQVAELSRLQTVIDAQDKLLNAATYSIARAEKMVKEQGDYITRLTIELRSFTEAAP